MLDFPCQKNAVALFDSIDSKIYFLLLFFDSPTIFSQFIAQAACVTRLQGETTKKVYIDVCFRLRTRGIDGWIRTEDQKFMKPDGTRDINDRFTDENNLDFDSEGKKK